MGVQLASGPFETALYVVGVELCRREDDRRRRSREPRERDPSRLAEPDGAPEDTRVVTGTAEGQVNDGEEPSAADAAQVGGRGAQRPAVEDAVAGASHRVGVRTEDEAATAALRRKTQKRAVEHGGVRLDQPRTPHERELAAEKARVRRDGAEQMILEHRDVGDPILAQLARNVPGRSQRALGAE